MVDTGVQKRPPPEKGLSAPQNLRVYSKEGPVNSSHNNLCHSFMDRTVTVASSVEEWVTCRVASFSALLCMLCVPLTENQMHKHVSLVSVEIPDKWILKLHPRRYAEMAQSEGKEKWLTVKKKALVGGTSTLCSFTSIMSSHLLQSPFRSSKILFSTHFKTYI